MEVSFSELKEKEIVNVYDGKKLGRIIDILFDNSTGVVKGVMVPGEKKLFRKSEDIFVPLEKLKKIGDDVILVSLHVGGVKGYLGQSYGQQNYATQNSYYGEINAMEQNYKYTQNIPGHTKGLSYVRYKRIDKKKYK